MKFNVERFLLTMALAIALIPFTQVQLRAAQQNPPAQQDPGAAQQQQQEKSFKGTIEKSGDKLVLKSARGSFDLDDQEKAKSFEGKEVKVTGTMDAQTKTIHVTNIEPAS